MPIVDENIYMARVAGVIRWGTYLSVRDWAEKEIAEWLALGYRRTATIYYRDGNMVDTLHPK